VSPESDSGIDKLKVLAAINSASAPQPAAPASKPGERPPSATRRAVEPPAPSWFRHRSEIAALVAALVGMIWIAVGLAQKSWGPSLTGVAFGVASLAIWTLEVWSSD
jgi:hypothetical protein